MNNYEKLLDEKQYNSVIDYCKKEQIKNLDFLGTYLEDTFFDNKLHLKAFFIMSTKEGDSSYLQVIFSKCLTKNTFITTSYIDPADINDFYNSKNILSLNDAKLPYHFQKYSIKDKIDNF
jgi:hypothetical protein